MISIQKFTFNPFQENTYIVFDETKQCVIIDPGCYEPHEEQQLIKFIDDNELTPTLLLSTHSHIDHVLGNKFILEKYEIPHLIHAEDVQTLESVSEYAGAYGFMDYKEVNTPTQFIEEGKLIEFGNSNLEVRFVPGHAPGHVVFIAREEKFIVNGDCLFYGSIGRTDLPGGDHQTLLDSIKRELFTLPNDFTVYCGHGQETTIGFEKENNPYLN